MTDVPVSITPDLLIIPVGGLPVLTPPGEVAAGPVAPVVITDGGDDDLGAMISTPATSEESVTVA